MDNNVYVLKEAANGISQVDPGTELFNSRREIFLTEEVNAGTSARLLQQLICLEEHDRLGKKEYKPITLYINSPGGEIKSGLAVYDYMRRMKSSITTVCIGCASSMGAILFLAGDTRLMLPHTEIMIHDASFGNADFSGLKPGELKSRAKSLEESSRSLRKIVAERTGRSLNEVTRKMREDSYFKCEEAISFGLATGIF